MSTTLINNECLPNGEHYLSGIDDYKLNWGYGYDDEMIDCKVFIIDDEPYCIFSDPDDGYRSYGVIHKLKDNSSDVCKNMFPPQKVKIETIHELEEENDDNMFGVDSTITTISNIDTNEIIVRVGTDHSDSYYPIGIFEYHPEYLPINSIKAIKKFEAFTIDDSYAVVNKQNKVICLTTSKTLIDAIVYNGEPGQYQIIDISGGNYIKVK